MKTPVVTVMRTQGARRSHQQAVESNKLQKWIRDEKEYHEDMVKKRLEQSLKRVLLLSELSDRFSRM